MIDTSTRTERAILVGLINQFQEEHQAEEFLDELAFLAQTLNIVAEKRFLQKLSKPQVSTFVGTGKLEEIVDYVKRNEIDCVIFDDDLTPSQMRNLEKEIEVKIYDRSLLILDIFQFRAQTAQAKTQVELARYQYLLPRLTRMWTHLERQRGGTGTRGGAGEKEIETDRRIIRDKIAKLKVDLSQIDKVKKVQRKNRDAMVRVALVGYTNVGKSTLMNLLSKSDVFAENKLFATLDTTVRKVVLNRLPFLLSDTVGFIRKLPHQLIESFKSTLDEVRESDILIHVVDISHKNFEDHIKTVDETIRELILDDEKIVIMVFNKIDKLPDLKDNDLEQSEQSPFINDLKRLKKTWIAKEKTHAIFMSAAKKKNVEELRNKMLQQVKNVYQTKYPYNHYIY